jgi:hypothetical protein
MSRNQLQSSSTSQTYPQDGYRSNDLERNDLVAGERYELQDRSATQLSLDEFLDEVGNYGEMVKTRLMIIKKLHLD